MLLDGYAIRWNDPAEDRNECFAEHAFDWWIGQHGRSIRLLSEHEPDVILAQRRDGSLCVWTDRVGLAFEAYLPVDCLPWISDDIMRGRMAALSSIAFCKAVAVLWAREEMRASRSG